MPCTVRASVHGSRCSRLPVLTFLNPSQGVLVVERDTGSDGFAGNHTFIVHEGRDSKQLHGNGAFGGTISLELLACPGYFVTAPAALPNSTIDGGEWIIDNATWADDPDLCHDILAGGGTDICRGSHAGAIRMLYTSISQMSPAWLCLRAACYEGSPFYPVHADILQIHCRMSCQTSAILNTAFTLQPANSSPPERSSLWTTLPMGRYPAGSRILLGQDRQYVVSPLNKIVDEPYTAFFEVSR